jgi:molybdate/tungstate transport system substrate-binding protein
VPVAVASVAVPLVAGAGRAAAAAKGTGPVDVLYAGSFVTVMQTYVDAAFHAATGYSVTGISGGSTALATEIKGGVHTADVYISASPTATKTLMGAANGTWVTWYLTFATSPLELGYNPSSSFAKTLKTQPWWKVITKTGFLLGRTNPVTDPKGRLAVSALDKMAKKEKDPALSALATKTTNVYTETTMVGRLQAGQLDAGFFYAVEAKAAKFPTVPLKGVTENATYTITVVAKAPHPTAADAFVSYMLSSKAKALLKKEGLTEMSTPTLTGPKSALPASLKKVLK